MAQSSKPAPAGNMVRGKVGIPAHLSERARLARELTGGQSTLRLRVGLMMNRSAVSAAPKKGVPG
jgi:hypothetical protein